SPGHVRLILEELFCLQAGLELKRRRAKRQTCPRMGVSSAVRQRLKQILPFHPTDDQKSALREIVADLAGGHPMRRLLHGDVGSGKTIVALQAAVIAIENGYQVAIMAPTQILAEQHYLYARQRLPGCRIELVTASAPRPASASSRSQLLVGTHALLAEDAHFFHLGLVVVDEQHRFGVLQRFLLMHKSRRPAAAVPHVLVMTATPIPRTLALALYGDLDCSMIRQPPPGCLPIATRVVPQARSAEVYDFVRQRVLAGRQAYFVYPTIDDSPALDLKPALRMYECLRRRFSGLRVGLLHGRLAPEARNAVMRQFRAGELQVLVSTTIIEVGLDVPNATLMVIEHAERFGISQLHQLRGRVGRPQPSPPNSVAAKAPRLERAFCFLIHDEPCTDLAHRRLAAVAGSSNGFELAEADLTLRGPGEFFGTRQSGLPAFRVAQPLRDQDLMELARSEASSFLDRASSEEQRSLVRDIQGRWQRPYGLVEVG
ncbi:MAG TPA: ATP-dependent DNA helicase RecG, partial [Candidatus Sulfopaludibacter sp.]|nr:ATP-dependent DNA helicase RecG [Candidatus Sulfopaludibacter sp.]